MCSSSEARLRDVLLDLGHAHGLLGEVVGERNPVVAHEAQHIIERRGELLKPHQDASGQVKQSRWSKCWEMWQELARIIHQNHQG